MGGDLNEILRTEEKYGGAQKDSYFLENFKEALDDCNLKDTVFEGPDFTWCNRRRVNCTWERLDRFLCNLNFESLFDNFTIKHLDWLSSNHRPIEFSLRNPSSGTKGRKNHCFKFEECWTIHDECKNIIKEERIWHPSAQFKIPCLNQNLNRCVVALKQWGRSITKGFKSKIIKCKRALQDAYNCFPNVDFDEIHGIEFELESLLEEEEIYWRQRSREDWLKWGDQNSKWFHKRASMRKKKNEIKGIMDINGVWTEEQVKIEDTFIQYFQNLFSSSNPTKEKIEEILKNINPMVDKQMNDALTAPFSHQEVEKAVGQMFPTEAPSPDGFPALFFQKYWDVVGPNTISNCLEILNNATSI